MIPDDLRRHIEANPVTGSPAEMRAAFERLAGPSDAGQPVEVAGVPGRWHGPEQGVPLVWLHGGGFVFGSARSHGRMIAHLQPRVRRPVFVPDYPLAPEHPWPDPLSALRRVMDTLGPCDLGGDSAGGQLALVQAIEAPGSVRRLALISPNTDRTGRSATRGPNSGADLMNDDAQDAGFARMCFGDGDPAGRAQSPLLHLTGDLPPVWITAATNEVLLDDTLLLIRRLGRSGVAVEARILPGLFHLWPLWPDVLPDARRTLADLAAFLRH